jgi:glycosyltransferase involved in cell wall biosynthesis
VGVVQEAVVIIPCFNEESRLETGPWLRLASEPGIRLLFLDDGSSDRTPEIIGRICADSCGSIRLHSLTHNRGKAEAVRVGMTRAIREAPSIVGYVDADLSTPVEEVIRLIRKIESSSASVVMGSRVALSGYHIRRDPLRHYLGRVFATAASAILRATIYDTQCGAKFFRAGPLLEAVLEEPFHANWAFDVELLGRLLTGTPRLPPLEADDILEVPLHVWKDVPGSKMSAGGMIRAAFELVVIAASLRRKRRRVRDTRRR